MDARVRTGATAYNQPAGAGPSSGACPPPGSSSGAGGAGAGGTVGESGATGSGAAGAGTSYSSSFGDVGMSDVEAGASGPADSNGHSGRGPGEAFKEAGARLGELKEFASYYVAAKLDAIKVTGRNLGIYAALGIVGLIAASAVITTAVVLLLVGLALAIGKPFDPDQPWVGAIVVGLLVLGGIAGGTLFFMKKLTSTARKQLVEKYENRQRDQRIHYGEDVRGRRAGVGR